MKKNRLEWTVFGVSLALIVCVVALLIREQMTGSRRPAAIAVLAGDAVRSGDSFAVPLDVSNEGDTTAEDVRIEATVTWGDAAERGEAERGEAVLPFVPYRSHRRAWLTFTRDPRGGTLTTRVLGYREP